METDLGPVGEVLHPHAGECARPADGAEDRRRTSLGRREEEINVRTVIKLVSTAGTGHFYTTTRNPKLQSGKLELRKYDPVVRKHVPYREAKA